MRNRRIFDFDGPGKVPLSVLEYPFTVLRNVSKVPVKRIKHSDGECEVSATDELIVFFVKVLEGSYLDTCCVTVDHFIELHRGEGEYDTRHDDRDQGSNLRLEGGESIVECELDWLRELVQMLKRVAYVMQVA